MKSKIIKFFLLGYGKAYDSALKIERTSGNARVSAMMQFALLLTLNWFSVYFFMISLCMTVGVCKEFTEKQMFYINFLVFLSGGLLILFARKLSVLYVDEYEKTVCDRRTLLKIAVDIYPYFVLVLLVVSISIYVST